MEEDAQTNIEKEIKELSENSLFSYKTLNKKKYKGSGSICNIIIWRAGWVQKNNAVWKKVLNYSQ